MNKTPLSWSQKYYDQLQVELNKFYANESPIDAAQYIEQIKVVEQFSFDKKRFFCLFSHIKFFPLYVSQNAKTEFGYAPKEIYKRGLIFALKKTYWKQVPMVVKVHQWGQRFQKIVGDDTPMVNREVFFCGLKLKDAEGNIRTLCIKQRILTAKNNNPILSFLDAEDITSLIKSDFVWARMTAKRGQQSFCRAFFQNSTKKEYADILSKREFEILHLIIKQKKNTEISELLEISTNTIERHRKNMIARIGVTDMTALIQICNSCGII